MTDEIVEVVAKLLMSYGEGEFGPDFADGIILDAKAGHKGDCSKCEPHLVGAFTCSACMVEDARNDAAQFLAAITANGLKVVNEQREFICHTCYLRTEEGKPENYQPF